MKFVILFSEVKTSLTEIRPELADSSEAVLQSTTQRFINTVTRDGSQWMDQARKYLARHKTVDVSAAFVAQTFAIRELRSSLKKIDKARQIRARQERRNTRKGSPLCLAVKKFDPSVLEGSVVNKVGELLLPTVLATSALALAAITGDMEVTGVAMAAASVVATTKKIPGVTSTKDQKGKIMLEHESFKKQQRIAASLAKQALRKKNGDIDRRSKVGKKAVDIKARLARLGKRDYDRRNAIKFVQIVMRDHFPQADWHIVSRRAEKGDAERAILDASLFSDQDDRHLDLTGWHVALSWIHDGELRALVTDRDCGNYSQFLGTIGLQVDVSKNEFKPMKYIGTMFRAYMTGKLVNRKHVKEGIRQVSHEKYVDGMVAYISETWARRALNARVNTERYNRVSIRILRQKGLDKGHAVILPADHWLLNGNDICWIISKDKGAQTKSEIKWTGCPKNKMFIGLDPVHRSERVFEDIQTLINTWGGIKGEVREMITVGVRDLMDHVKSGDALHGLNDVEKLFELPDREYALQAFARRNAAYEILPFGINRVWNFYSERLNKLWKFNFTIPGAVRVYATCDLTGKTAPGTFRVEGANLYIAPSDVEEFLKRAGGGDQDDSFVVVFHHNGSALLTRSPNQLGEYAVLNYDQDGSDYEPTHTWDIDYDGLHPVKELVEAESADSSSIRGILKDEEDPFADFCDDLGAKEYDAKLVLRVMRKMDGVNIGVAANKEMIEVACFGHLLDEFRIDLELIIDCTVKDGRTPEYDEEMEKVDAFWNHLAKSGVAVPECLLCRLPEAYRSTVKVAKEHWLDELLGFTRLTVGQANRAMNTYAIGVGDRLDSQLVVAASPKSSTKAIRAHYAKMVAEKWIPVLDKLRELRRTSGASLEEIASLEEASTEGRDLCRGYMREHLATLTPASRLQFVRELWNLVYLAPSEKGEFADSILFIPDKEGLPGTLHSSLRHLELCGYAGTLAASNTGVYVNWDTSDVPTKAEADAFVAKPVEVTLVAGLSRLPEDEKAAWFTMLDQVVEDNLLVFGKNDKGTMRAFVIDEEGEVQMDLAMAKFDCAFDEVKLVEAWRVHRSQNSAVLVAC